MSEFHLGVEMTFTSTRPSTDDEFDAFIDEVVTEEGSYSSEGVKSLVDRTPFLSQGYALLS